MQNDGNVVEMNRTIVLTCEECACQLWLIEVDKPQVTKMKCLRCYECGTRYRFLAEAVDVKSR